MSEERDYSGVQWPWDDDPNWGPPREGATSDPGNDDNWVLACAECDLRFPMDYNVGNIAEHWKGHYPEFTDEHQEPGIQLNLVWVGLGTPPKGGKQ